MIIDAFPLWRQPLAASDATNERLARNPQGFRSIESPHWEGRRPAQSEQRDEVVDYGAAAVLFVLGCVHNFVAAPLSFDALDTRALWFITGGIVLWYAAIVNLLWIQRERPLWLVWAAVVFANFVLLGFAVLFMAVKQSWTDPQNLALLAPTVWLTARTLLGVRDGAR